MLPGEFGSLGQLQRLDLSYNSLYELPTEFANLQQLQQLNLRYCNMHMQFSELARQQQSQQLDLGSHRLGAILGIINSLHQLQQLDVTNNTFLTHLTVLEQLDRADLTLTPSLEETRRATERRHNGGRRRARRTPAAIQNLAQKINSWRKYANSASNIDTTGLSESEKSSLQSWLKRLEATVDFKHCRTQLANTVWHMLEALTNKQHPTFKQHFFWIVSDNLSNCDDRAAMSFNLLHTCWKIHCGQSGNTLGEKLCSLAALARTELLRNEVSNQLDQAVLAGRVNRAALSESVEAFIYWETKLKSELRLDTAIDFTHYTLGKRFYLDEQALKTRVKKDCINTMTSMELVQNLWRESPSVDRRQLEPIENKMSELDDSLLDNTISSDDYNTQSKQLNEAFNEIQSKLIAEWIKSNLPEEEHQLLALDNNL